MGETIYDRELPIKFKDDAERESAKKFVLDALLRGYSGHVGGYLEIMSGGYPGIVVYVDSDRGPLLEITVIFKERVRYIVKGLDPVAGQSAARNAARIVESLILGFFETGGRGAVYFVYVPGKRIIPPRMESGLKSLLQKLFLGNMVFLFAFSILISYAIYLAVGPRLTPVVLLLAQVPLVLMAHKITAAIMGDWKLDRKHGSVYLVGLRMSIEKYQDVMPRIFLPKRYEIKKRIYEKALGQEIEANEDQIRKILQEYGLQPGEFEVELKRIRLYDVVEAVAREFGIRNPAVYLSNIIIPNAAASGVTPRFSSLIVTTGLLTRLEEGELKAVIGHEASHLKNHDVVTFFLLSSLEYITRVYVSLFLWPLLFGYTDFFLMMLYLYFSITLLFFVAKFVEARADLDSAIRLNAADKLASALRKIGIRKIMLESASPASRLANWLALNPHPPTTYRIERLEALARGEPVSGIWREAIKGCIKDFARSLIEAL